jgi:tryptophanyl-tRNA synthetase
MRILSGIQPSGKLHLGNYFGMIKPAVELQDKGQAFYFIADYHALTTMKSPSSLRKSIMEVALDFISCGIDPEKTFFYKQSDVPEVHELAWLLSIVTPVGLLERCHSYKDKIAKGLPSSHGLFAYPVLMAADILAVQSDQVPVGQDQKQHVEVARDIAQKFNGRFGEVFKLPEPIIRREVAVVPGTDGQKMSKSYGNTIEIFGDEKSIRKKIMKIPTDSRTVDEPKDPGKCNVFALYKLVASKQETDHMAQRYIKGGLGYGEVKQELFEKLMQFLSPMYQKRSQLQNNPERITQILKAGKENAKSVISETLKNARKAVGLE